MPDICHKDCTCEHLPLQQQASSDLAGFRCSTVFLGIPESFLKRSGKLESSIELIEINPFHKIQIKYKEPFILPKTIPINNIEQIIRFAYLQLTKAKTDYTKKVALRNTLILELLFATGMRISELCTLTTEQIDFNDYIIKIYGKGSKERLISNLQSKCSGAA